MHDIDRSFMETEDEGFEFSNEYQGEGDGEGEGEAGYGTNEVFSEGEVEQLAAELLSVSSEEELDHFLGSLIKKAGGAIGKFVKNPIGKQMGGILKGLAKKALPIAGSALGNFVVPGLGGALGGQLASQAGSMFGLELEGLSQEDQQFEVSKQFVRLAGDAVKGAVQAASNGKSPTGVVRDGLVAAAEKYAPGLLGGAAQLGAAQLGGGASGRWVRRGNKIVLFGV